VYGITDLTTFVLGTIFIVLLPGPNSVFVLTTASMRGVRAGYWAAFGVFVGDTILMVLASTGAASVLYANPALFTALKYAGAAYLAWIGIGLVRDAYKGWFHPQAPEKQLDSPIDGQRPSPQCAEAATREHIIHLAARSWRDWGKPPNQSPFRSALVISLLNPKAIFFFISFFVQFVDPRYQYPVLTFLLLGIIVQVFSVSYLAGLVHGGVHLASRLRQYPRLNAVGAAAVGSIFIWFGVKLASATL
jgi:leucine efflux protein